MYEFRITFRYTVNQYLIDKRNYIGNNLQLLEHTLELRMKMAG